MRIFLDSVMSYPNFPMKMQLYFFENLAKFFRFLSKCVNLCYKTIEKEFERILEDSNRIKVAFFIERTVFQVEGNLPVDKLFIALILCSRFTRTSNSNT